MKRSIVGAVVLAVFFTVTAWALVPTADTGFEYMMFLRSPETEPAFGLFTRLGVFDGDFGFLISIEDAHLTADGMTMELQAIGVDFAKKFSRAVQVSLGYGRHTVTVFGMKGVGSTPYIDLKGDFQLLSSSKGGAEISLMAGTGYRWLLEANGQGDHLLSRLFINIGL